jgi:4-alpha-glucanotransferase
VLLHPTALPATPGNGDFGHEAYRFIEFLAASGISVWQTLPLGPTHEDGSPYQCLSVHAGNSLFISLDWLKDRGWLAQAPDIDSDTSPAHYRKECLQQAWHGFQELQDQELKQEYQDFIEAKSAWLDEYALFMAIRRHHEHSHWLEWPEPLRDRHTNALNMARQTLRNEIDQTRFEQFVFFRQWHELRGYARQHGIQLFGDMPIFVSHDSAEVWAHREYFAINEHGQALTVAGVPPDYFSETGQRWGNPHYHWARMQEDGFQWWLERMQTQLELFDLVRIDHFRGFESCWEIPAESETAIDGHWVKAPGEALLNALFNRFHNLPLIAEDLGTITPEVTALLQQFNLPGMKVLQFAFDGDPDNLYLPHNHIQNCVVYTGTHDNDTTLGWHHTLSPEQQGYLHEYLNHPEEEMPWPMVRSALQSVAQLAVVPLQDILALNSEHRFNTPGTIENNWQWRFNWEQVPHDLPQRLHRMVEIYGRKITSDH